MTQPTCLACGSALPAAAARCPGCGAAAGAATTHTTPKWIWWAAGIGCGCLVLVVVLGVLATLFVPNVVERLELARQAKVASDLTRIAAALEEYAANNGARYPEDLEALVLLDANGASYLNTPGVPRDPWGREYLYEPPGPDRPAPRVFTLGKDGAPGGEGEDEDLDSTQLREPR